MEDRGGGCKGRERRVGERREGKGNGLGAIHLALRQHSDEQGVLPEQVLGVLDELRAAGRGGTGRGGPGERPRAFVDASRQPQHGTALGACQHGPGDQRRHSSDDRGGALAGPVADGGDGGPAREERRAGYCAEHAVTLRGGASGAAGDHSAGEGQAGSQPLRRRTIVVVAETQIPEIPERSPLEVQPREARAYAR